MSRNHSNLKSRGQQVTFVIKFIEKNALTINFISVRHTSYLKCQKCSTFLCHLNQFRN